MLQTSYKAPFLLRNGHLNTLYAYWRCKVPMPPFVREEVETRDGDFFSVDWWRGGYQKVILLLHGLEGSSSSTYIRRVATLAHAQGYDVCAINHRSCGGKLNRKPVLYHSGFTQDLHQMVQQLDRDYESIFAVGYSLGGNILLKYLGDGVFEVPGHLKQAVAVSTPVHLHSCAKAISQPSNFLYEMGFLRGLKQKMEEKAVEYPELIDLEQVKSIRRLVQFDDMMTAPIHGFANAVDYYTQCSSLPFLDKITIPTLLVNAQDDPMLRAPSFPYEMAESNPFFHFLAPKYGGHVGFADFKTRYYWIDRLILSFFDRGIPGDKSY